MYVIFMTSVPLSRRGSVSGSSRNRVTRRATSNCNQGLQAVLRYFVLLVYVLCGKNQGEKRAYVFWAPASGACGREFALQPAMKGRIAAPQRRREQNGGVNTRAGDFYFVNWIEQIFFPFQFI